ncbi:MAG: cytochrome c [Deltaproteobacteria bacterium]|nr:cytochrome c [Deltaproteobacteria bacterium]
MEEGRGLYLENCSSCHGHDGQGANAPALRKEGLLATVDTDYFVNTMNYGRPIRGCPSFEKRMTPAEMEKVAFYIKGWQKGETLSAPTHVVVPKDTQRARDIFILCGGCHGLEHEGAMGPPLLDPGFLLSVSDTALRRTIMYGRPGTPMKGYLEGMGGLAELTPEEIDGLIAYIRYRERSFEKTCD